MDLTLLPQDLVTRLDYIAPGVKGLRIVLVNVFGVSHRDGSWTLVDTGLPSAAPYIRRWAEEEFHLPPKAILLTHGHIDHAGAASELAQAWDCSIQAHPFEFPYLAGDEQYPAPADGDRETKYLRAGHGSQRRLDLGSRLRPATDLLGWEMLHTPGHSPGHMSFFRTGEGTLLTGDAVRTIRSDSAEGQYALQGPPSVGTVNWEHARQSIRGLADLKIITLAPSHGDPLAGADIPVLLRKLGDNLDRDARGEQKAS